MVFNLPEMFPMIVSGIYMTKNKNPMSRSAENGIVAVELKYHAKELTVIHVESIDPGNIEIARAILRVHFLPPKYL